ncbi:MAG: alpha-glucan family phosphorylase [Desulfonatronovibrionaceae bacterium]
MRPVRIYSVIPRLPEELRPLWDLAYNFWFTWRHEIQDLFSQIDPYLWRKSRANPVWFLNHLEQDVLEDLSRDSLFLERLETVHGQLEDYKSESASRLKTDIGQGSPVVAYFSAEYGICLCLPVYSGGLGVLAGDHLKSASDLNIPLVGIGLCYQQGYFRQYLTSDGWQQERYPINDFEQMPLTLVKDGDGDPVRISVDLEGREIQARLWQARVGRVDLYLLDSNVLENEPRDRELTGQLYGGDLEMRLKQEILLGIGGVRALRALDLSPKVIHMNEGHSAFAGLERIRTFMSEHGLSFEAAQEIAASSSVFTTHTPVPAGNDRFPPELMRRFFEGYAQRLGLAFKVLLALGREDPRNEQEHFCMTVLALRLSRFNNGVSQLHSKVSQNMWQRVWPRYPVDDVPIGAVTNGVHIPTWVAPDISDLLDRYLGGNWREDPDYRRVWKQAETIPDAELWRTHERLRERLIEFVRSRLKDQLVARNGRRYDMQMAEDVLDPRALTIGFARRFATYKRANLLLKDEKRLMDILQNKECPVQFIFAGKAHPKDTEGKKIIQQIVQLCKSEGCRSSLVFLEDYDLETAQYMLQGCDVWLNTPRRPLEACGTSGMKAVANGVLNFSTVDGWWAEVSEYGEDFGWSIGGGEEYENKEYQDFIESQILYNILENDIIPLYYERGHGNLPRAWIAKMKSGLMHLAPDFNAHRMVGDYVHQAYKPAVDNYDKLVKDDYQPAKDLAAWRMDLMTKWGEIRIRNVASDHEAEIFTDQEVEVTAEVYLNGLNPDDVSVEIYAGEVNFEGAFANRKTVRMNAVGATPDGWKVYSGKVAPDFTGRFGYTVRALPYHPLLLDPHCLGLICWASEQ